MRLSRVPVDSRSAFPSGVMVVRISPRRRWVEDTKQFGSQEVDQDTNRPVWTVDGYDVHAMMADPVTTKDGRQFRESAEVKIYVIAAQEPVIPAGQVNGLRGVGQFQDLVITPWISNKNCQGLQHDEGGDKLPCGCRINISFRAYGLEPYKVG